MTNILQDLEYRGIIYQTANREELEKKLENERVTLYIGFDPTADSLHIGHLLPILTLRRFQQAGHLPIALVGGGTGMIGDPSGRSTERVLNSVEVVQGFTETIRNQLSRFLDFSENRENPARIVNNYDWLGSISLIEFLRDIGKNFTVNYMLAKDSVDSRMANGISFTEFSYMIMQAYDFYQLNERMGCSLQLGGSDQWGNITAGLDLISKQSGNQVFGITMPLITKSDGTKFGKSAGNAVWLDPEKTSPYQFYQFWVNTDDLDVIKFLKYFTFLPAEEITRLEAAVSSEPEKREAQKVLAAEMTKLVHGEGALESAIRITQALFSGSVNELSKAEVEEAFKDVPSTTINDPEMALTDLLLEVKAAPSKRQARQDIESGAVTVNGTKVTRVEAKASELGRIGDVYLILRRGKKNYFLVRFTE
ncbi:tyrosine--tRNA ligase [Gorillibacterium timonense]|uniref:tyrosine--tRNA ligase n=1 Tax=Gorillibacterium timonense TaxID=1689269 RepID=UPI00071DAA44